MKVKLMLRTTYNLVFHVLLQAIYMTALENVEDQFLLMDVDTAEVQEMIMFVVAMRI